MKIRLACPHCTKTYSLDSAMAGKSAKCKQCSNVFKIPVQSPSVALPVATPVQPTPSPEAVPARVVRATPVAAETPPPPPPNISSFDLMPNDQYSIGDTRASNPGKLKIDILKYASSYPFWFLFWHTSLLVSAALCFFSFWFLPLVLFFAFCVWKYWGQVRDHFMKGCANPAAIVSLDPPLIAAFTNLTKGDYPTEIIRVMRQPIHSLSTGTPQVGLKIPVVALYENYFDNSPHWSSFDPKPAALASSDLQAIQRVYDTFDRSDWKELDDAIAQIPKPIEVGHYRIYSEEQFRKGDLKSEQQIVFLLQRFLTELDLIHFQFDEEVSKRIANFVPDQFRSRIVCVFDNVPFFSRNQFGLAFTASHIFFVSPETGKGHIPYSSIAGAFSSDKDLEITLRNRQRIRFPSKHLTTAFLGVADILINEIVGLPLEEDDVTFH